MRRSFALAGLAAAIAGAAVSFTMVPNGPSQAANASSPTFMISANDGYGFGECLLSGSACGKVVADSWCEAQGFARSVSFSLVEAEDVTGTIAGQPAARSARPISITCSE